MEKDDILAFLDAKFAKTKPKKPKKKKAKKPEGAHQAKPAQKEESLLEGVLQAQSGEKPAVTAQTVYKELVPQANSKKEPAGVRALKDHHMRDEKLYQTDVKDKIFFIGQNAIQGTSAAAENAPVSINDITTKRRATGLSQQAKRLSKNTIKQLQRMQEMQAPALKYETFARMNTLWLQYIKMVLQARPEDLKGGLDLADSSIQQNFCGKLVKADFSGAHVTIVKARNKSVVGDGGLIVRETARTFTVIKPDDSTSVLLKEGTVFQLKLPGELVARTAADEPRKEVRVNVWGDSVLYKGSERSKVKFKIVPGAPMDLY